MSRDRVAGVAIPDHSPSCFFALLVEYLGGERSLIILLHGRKVSLRTARHQRSLIEDAGNSAPVAGLALPVSDGHLRPLYLPRAQARHLAYVDVLKLHKQGSFSSINAEYVQVKPVLAVLTMIFKATGTYKDGSLSGDNGYTYVSIAYNLSVSISLYSLAMFWVCTNSDLKPFRWVDTIQRLIKADVRADRCPSSSASKASSSSASGKALRSQSLLQPACSSPVSQSTIRRDRH